LVDSFFNFDPVVTSPKTNSNTDILKEKKRERKREKHRGLGRGLVDT